MIQRVRTGIKGFDNLIEGGMPEKSTILLEGGAGTGKTIFALQFIHNGAVKFLEPGLYITLQDSKEALIEQANRFKMNLADPKIQVEYISPRSIGYISDTVKIIAEKIDKMKAKRLVIDSLPALYINGTVSKRNDDPMEKLSERRFIYEILEEISKLKVTTLLINHESESSFDNDLRYLAEYVCEGVIELSLDPSSKASRKVCVKEMHSTTVDTNSYPFIFGKEGIELVVKKK